MGPEEVGPKQRLGDLSDGEVPLKMSFVEFQWDAALPVGADAAPVGGCQLRSLAV